jgi:hypothetical protein
MIHIYLCLHSWVYGFQRHFQQYLSYNVTTSFIGGRVPRENTRMSPSNLITYCGIQYSSPERELTTLVVLGTDCMDSK